LLFLSLLFPTLNCWQLPSTNFGMKSGTLSNDRRRQVQIYTQQRENGDVKTNFLLAKADSPSASDFLLDLTLTGLGALVLLRTRGPMPDEEKKIVTPSPKATPVPAPAPVPKSTPAPKPTPPSKSSTPAAKVSTTKLTPQAPPSTPPPKREAKTVMPSALLAKAPPGLKRIDVEPSKDETPKETESTPKSSQVVESTEVEKKGLLSGVTPKLIIGIVAAAIIGVITSRPF